MALTKSLVTINFCKSKKTFTETLRFSLSLQTINDQKLMKSGKKKIAKINKIIK